MGKLLIRGGGQLRGEVRISGAKNAVLPILAASILASEPVLIKNVPHLDDVTTLITLLSRLGVKLVINNDSSVKVDSSTIQTTAVNKELAQAMRASILVLGPLVSRFGHAQVALPGGCAIGARPVDLHLAALEALGAQIEIKDDQLFVSLGNRPKLIGAEYTFPKVTVGGTENIIMAACLATGTTTLNNAACEPEIIDLANFLNSLGAKITGAGTSQVIIHGVKSLGGGEYSVIPDRVETGTFLVGAAMTGGKITTHNTDPKIMQIVLDKLTAAGAKISCTATSITLDMENKRPQAVDIETGPYPGFPTDLQAHFIALNSIALGRGLVSETIFENRFLHVNELQRMGADIVVEKQLAICQGIERLTGTKVTPTDLRASASLVLAGLVAEGLTEIDNTDHIDRGYERIEEKLLQLGADIQRQHD